MTPHSIQYLKCVIHLCTLAVITSVSACQTHEVTDSNPALKPLKKNTAKVQPTTSITQTAQIKPQKILPTELHTINHQGIQFNLITYDTRTKELIVADQPNGPNTIWSDSEAAANAHNGLAAINAGFFTPEGKPLGIVIAAEKKAGSNNPSSLGSGLFYHTTTGAKISRRSIWTTLSKAPPAHLLQAGPMLLENEKPIQGLSSQNARPRSFIATDGKNHWCIGHAEACTLSQLSKALLTLKTPLFKPTSALNLDGGRSSDLWVSSSVKNGPQKIRPFWNKPVRNFLILKNK